MRRKTGWLFLSSHFSFEISVHIIDIDTLQKSKLPKYPTMNACAQRISTSFELVIQFGARYPARKVNYRQFLTGTGSKAA